ncbi:hypothetical protein GGR92_004153 [Spirosoma lacussanchae]|uniref:DUF2281 domain-containing protein n=1 Tax=Spirosoma lacussanchae TaxID=1884249 RepID=UPI0011095874|nr:DUF2281 domain-containing protein [Spirosoma lacussanchae]
MEITVQIEFSELVQAIQKLSPEQRKSLQDLLSHDAGPASVLPERTFGTLGGLVTYMADDFDAPLGDFNEYM